MTGHERCSEAEMYLIARAAARVGAARAMGCGALCAADVTVTQLSESLTCIVLIAHDGTWRETAYFVRGSMSLSIRFGVGRKDPVYGAT